MKLDLFLLPKRRRDGLLEETKRLVLVYGREGVSKGGVGGSEIVAAVFVVEKIGPGVGRERRGEGGIEVVLNKGFVGVGEGGFVEIRRRVRVDGV